MYLPMEGIQNSIMVLLYCQRDMCVDYHPKGVVIKRYDRFGHPQRKPGSSGTRGVAATAPPQ